MMLLLKKNGEGNLSTLGSGHRKHNCTIYGILNIIAGITLIVSRHFRNYDLVFK